MDRNRLKRRLRELARLRLLPTLAGATPADVVVRILPPAYGAPFPALAADVERALRQLVKTPLPVRRPAAPKPGAAPPDRPPTDPPAAPTPADPV